MKPKNRIYCREVGRSKLLFETEKKANLFIKFNADVIEEESGRRPERCYYCETCAGWHVTSMKEKPHYRFTRAERAIKAYNNLIEL